MIVIKTRTEIEIMQEGAEILSQMFGYISQFIKPGAIAKDIDYYAEKFILQKNALPSFKGYHGYPATLCISPNEQVVHGIPGDYVFKESDIISIDGGIFYKGYHVDMAYTFIIGKTDELKKKLVNATYKALYIGIKKAVPGATIGDIGYAIQSYIESNNFNVVRDLVGHGIGKNLHEDPQVPNFGEPGTGVKLAKGMTLAIEPMVNAGKKEVINLKDKWTVVTADGLPSAHFEHTIVITENGNKILTTYKYIKNNNY
ncbi:MAG: type I methionyl aminopeptidase [Bacteroidales bacterium]|nr:type I methionyl aminopeptidase [Bacteroidales bacterium]